MVADYEDVFTGPSYGWRGPVLPGRQLPIADTSEITVLKAVDPTVDMPPIVNQLQLGACTANATARVFRGDSIRDGHDCGALSRLGIYYDERYLEGSLGQGDTGAIGHDAFTSATKWGLGLETEWAYNISTFQSPPALWAPGQTGTPNAQHAYTLTKPVKSVTPELEDIKRVLSNGQKVAVGFTVYESFEEGNVATTGIIPMPDPSNEKVIGGHEIIISGFEPSEPLYLWADNSWSVQWGIKGRMLIPVAYILSRRYAADWRTIQRPVGK